MIRVTIIAVVVVLLFLLQIGGGMLQAKNYQKAIHRVHKFGNVGFGQKRAGLKNGYLIMIACNREGIITGGEIMKGFTSFARFKPWTTFLGRDTVGTSIYEYLDELHTYTKRQKKQYKGYINALEALQMRIEQVDDVEDEDAIDDSTQDLLMTAK